jgi:hypothetical protein
MLGVEYDFGLAGTQGRCQAEAQANDKGLGSDLHDPLSLYPILSFY